MPAYGVTSDMAKMVLEIEMDNAAFDDEPMTETARILRKLATDLEWNGGPVTGDFYSLSDVNGNLVGWAKLYGK